jgi:hypothetical protein
LCPVQHFFLCLLKIVYWENVVGLYVLQFLLICLIVKTHPSRY